MHRVDREESSDETAPADGACHPNQQDKKHEDVRGMYQQVDDVVCAGVQPENLTHRHMNDPRHRMPESMVPRREGPDDAFPRQPGTDVWIVRDVTDVVERNEVVSGNLPENARREKDQSEDDQSHLLSRFHHDLSVQWRGRFARISSEPANSLSTGIFSMTCSPPL